MEQADHYYKPNAPRSFYRGPTPNQSQVFDGKSEMKCQGVGQATVYPGGYTTQLRAIMKYNKER